VRRAGVTSCSRASTLFAAALFGLGCNVEASRATGDAARADPHEASAQAAADAHAAPRPACSTHAGTAPKSAVDADADPMPDDYAEVYRVLDGRTGRWPALRYVTRREAVHEHSISFIALALADISRAGPEGCTDADRAIADMRRIADENPFGFTDDQRGRLRKIADQFQAVADAGRAIDGENIDAFLSATNPPPAR
jgi:hypothetical protein